MKTIKGQLFLTVHAAADEVYALDYATPPLLNILNTTEDNALISTESSFTDNNTAGQYITLPAGAAANSVSFPFRMVYIKAAADGDIVIERCG